MRPEILAEHIGTTINSLVNPIIEILDVHKKELSDLKAAVVELTKTNTVLRARVTSLEERLEAASLEHAR